MDAVASIDDFLRAPVGRYVAGGSYIVWVHDAGLLGNVHFGQPDQRDLDDHRRMFDLPLHRDLRPPFDVILDASGLERVDLAGYETFVWYCRHKLPRFVPLVRRMALIPPDRLVGATLLGAFHQFLAPRFRTRVVADRAAAFTWIGRRAGDPARAALDAVIEEVIGAPPLVNRVRACLAATQGLRIDEIARELGMSERSLQRELAAAGTSFRAEANRARLRHAETLLRDTTLKIETVARRVGYSSLANFSAQFRRLRGLSPSAFRRGGA